MDLVQKIEDVRRISLEKLSSNISSGDLDSIMFYLTNMDVLSDDSLYEKCLDILKAKIEDGDLKSISIFYNYF